MEQDYLEVDREIEEKDSCSVREGVRKCGGKTAADADQESLQDRNSGSFRSDRGNRDRGHAA